VTRIELPIRMLDQTESRGGHTAAASEPAPG
jgi:hypothetical protein